MAFIENNGIVKVHAEVYYGREKQSMKTCSMSIQIDVY